MANTNDVKKVSYGKPNITGAIWSAPLGTELPNDAITDLGEPFNNLGYVSEDGLTNENSPDSETIKAWGGDTVLVLQTEKPDTFTYTLIEALNIDVLKEVYGSENVTGDIETGLTVTANAKPAEVHCVVIETMLKDYLKRIVIPNAQLSELGEIEYVDEDAVGYELTIQALPDEKGNTHYEYIQKKPQSEE